MSICLVKIPDNKTPLTENHALDASYGQDWSGRTKITEAGDYLLAIEAKDSGAAESAAEDIAKANLGAFVLKAD